MEKKTKIQKNDKDILWRVDSLRTESSLHSGELNIVARLIGIPKNHLDTSFSEIRDELNCLLGADISKPRIDKVVYNDPATIILWKDGSKTVVKCQEGDTYDPETGFVMAYLKKMLGNDNTFNKEITKHVPANEIVKEQTQEAVEDKDYYKLQQERAKLIFILDNPRMTKKEMAATISDVVDGIDNIVMGKEQPIKSGRYPWGSKKRDTNFKVGDLVRIRSWDDMEKEFGINEFCPDLIDCRFGFDKAMAYLCGTEFHITAFCGDCVDNLQVYGLPDHLRHGYHISTDMIEKVK